MSNVKVLKQKFKAATGYHFGVENIKCRCKMYTLCNKPSIDVYVLYLPCYNYTCSYINMDLYAGETEY